MTLSKKRLIIFISLALLVSIAVTAFAEGNGSSMENAIVIKNISNYEKCETEDDISQEYGKSIGQEYAYMESEFGIKGKDWKLNMQRLIRTDDKLYDVIDIELLPSNEKKKLWFDVTEPLILLHQLEQKKEE